MKKVVCLFFVIIFVVIFSSCAYFQQYEESRRSEDSRRVEESLLAEESYYITAGDFYDKIVESIALIDVIATDVCSVWQDADYDDSAEKINKSIQKALSEHQEKIDAVKNLDVEIQAVYETARLSVVSAKVIYVMTRYIEYRDSVFNANAAFERHGYSDVSWNKESLDSALRELYVLL